MAQTVQDRVGVCTPAIHGVRTTGAAAVVSLPGAAYLPAQGYAPRPQGDEHA